MLRSCTALSVSSRSWCTRSLHARLAPMHVQGRSARFFSSHKANQGTSSGKQNANLASREMVEQARLIREDAEANQRQAQAQESSPMSYKGMLEELLAAKIGQEGSTDLFPTYTHEALRKVVHVQLVAPVEAEEEARATRAKSGLSRALHTNVPSFCKDDSPASAPVPSSSSSSSSSSAVAVAASEEEMRATLFMLLGTTAAPLARTPDDLVTIVSPSTPTIGDQIRLPDVSEMATVTSRRFRKSAEARGAIDLLVSVHFTASDRETELSFALLNREDVAPQMFDLILKNAL
jgi:hypothetical protein